MRTIGKIREGISVDRTFQVPPVGSLKAAIPKEGTPRGPLSGQEEPQGHPKGYPDGHPKGWPLNGYHDGTLRGSLSSPQWVSLSTLHGVVYIR